MRNRAKVAAKYDVIFDNKGIGIQAKGSVCELSAQELIVKEGRGDVIFVDC